MSFFELFIDNWNFQFFWKFFFEVSIKFFGPFKILENFIQSSSYVILIFFVSVYSITSRNNAPISNFGGGFRCKSEYPWCIIQVKSKHFPTVFKKIEKNKKKMTEKREFLRKTSFRPNRFFYMVVIQKLITVNTWNFHQMFMLVIYIYSLIFKNFWLFLSYL